MSGDSNYRSADVYQSQQQQQQSSPSSQINPFNQEGTNEGIYFPSFSSNDYISAELCEAYIFQEYYNQALAHLNSALRLNSLVFRSSPQDDKKIKEEESQYNQEQLYDTAQIKNQKNIDAVQAAREESSKRKQILEANNFHPNQEPSLTPQDIKQETEYKNEEFQKMEGIRKNKIEEQKQLAYALNRPKNNNLEDHQNLPEPSSNNQSKRLQTNQKKTLNGQQSQQESPINDSPQNLLLMNSPPPIQNPFIHIPLDDQDRQQIKRYQTHILMLQGKAYLQLKKPKHALKKLQTALKLNQRFYGEEHVSNASIYTILSQVYSRQKNFKLAIEQLQTVWELTQASRGPNSKSLASVHLELADVYYKQRDLEKAIENQKKGYEIFAGINQSTPQKNRGPMVGPEIIASVALTLSEWLEKAKRIEQAMDVLSKVEEIYEYIFGVLDRRTTKVKRSIAMLYLKINQYEKALNVFKVVQELEKTVYGKDSLQVGKTLKVIGTIQIILNNPNEARQVLQEASIIFKMKGQNKMLREVYNKLRLLEKTIKGGNRMIIENVTLDEEDEMENNEDAQQEEDQKNQGKRNEVINGKQIQQDKNNGITSKTTYPRSGSRKIKNHKMIAKPKGRMLQPLHKSSGTKTYKSSSSAFSQYENQRTMPPSPLKKGYPLEQQKIYYDNFHSKQLSPLNQRAMAGKNGSASSIGFSNNGYYRNVGSSKKRMKKAISQGSIRHNHQQQQSQNETGSSRVQLPQTSSNFKVKGKNINKMMPFPPKLPRNAWASPPKNQTVGRKTVNRSNMNNSNVPKKGEQMQTESERVTSLPYLSSPPQQQQQQTSSNSNRQVKNSKGSKMLISHSRTGVGQKIVFS